MSDQQTSGLGPDFQTLVFASLKTPALESLLRVKFRLGGSFCGPVQSGCRLTTLGNGLQRGHVIYKLSIYCTTPQDYTHATVLQHQEISVSYNSNQWRTSGARQSNQDQFRKGRCHYSRTSHHRHYFRGRYTIYTISPDCRFLTYIHSI